MIDVLTIIQTLALVVEAAALVYIYRLEKGQENLRKLRDRVDLRVDIDFPEERTEGTPCMWIENVGAGSGFIESAKLIAKDIATGQAWAWTYKMSGNRKLESLGSVRIDLAPGLRDLGSKWLKGGQPVVQITLWASVEVLDERRSRLTRDSTKFRTSVTGDTGELSELRPI